jgi:sugar phosphate isomerase/epimerase
MTNKLNRREVIAGGLAALAVTSCTTSKPKRELKISLAQYSFHRALFKKKGYKPMDALDFPKVTKNLGIDAVEYVGSFFPNREPDMKFTKEMLKRSKDAGVENLLIMVDRKGDLGDPDNAKRKQAVDNHMKWVEAAAVLGCHSIRVNARSQGTPAEQRKLLADGLRNLCAQAEKYNMNIIMENHGGLSGNGEWLASVVTKTNHPACGILPDFGNFWDRDTKKLYDPYKGIEAMLPHAKALSAKAFDVTPGSEYDMKHHKFGFEINFERMMKMSLESGYDGWIGIEYEGPNPEMNEKVGIIRTKKMIEHLWAKYA